MSKLLSSGKIVTLAIYSLALGWASQSYATTTQLSTSNTHSCMVTEAKTVECWGSNQYGQLGPNNTTGLKTAVPGLSNVLDVVTGEKHSCAIIDGLDPVSGETNPVKCWGNNSEGQLGTGNTISSSTPQYVMGGTTRHGGTGALVDAKKLIAGAAHTCVASASVMHCWGRNSSGQLGSGTITPYSASPVLVGNYKGYPMYPVAQTMAAGSNHTCAAASHIDYTYPYVYCWGAGVSGQLGNGQSQNSAIPSIVQHIQSYSHEYFANHIRLSAGNTHTCINEEDMVSCWGNWGSGTYTMPLRLDSSLWPLQIASGNNHVCAILSEPYGEVRCFGVNADGQMGNGKKTAYVDFSSWTKVLGLDSPALTIEAGGSSTCALLQNGSIACWGLNGAGQLGDATRINSVSAVATGWWKSQPVAQPGEGVQQISIGSYFTCALKNAPDSNDQVKCWGTASTGVLGPIPIPGDIEELPVNVIGFTPGKITSIASGRMHNCALFESGIVQCWGENASGQLGNGTTTSTPNPVTVKLAATDIAIGITAGSDFSCALLNNGTAKCWGTNAGGTLGAGLTVSRSTTPVTVSNLTNITQISGHGGHACALLADKTTRCWGGNTSGELGNGTTVSSNVPIANVLWINDVIKIEAGHFSTCALRASGTVWCWGIISANGVEKTAKYPENIPYLEKVTDVATGFYNQCVQFKSGTLKCFGRDQDGNMGSGSTSYSSGNKFLPNSVRYLPAPAKSVVQGYFMHACAILVTGQVACWGHNGLGQLGNGTTTNSSAPVLVKNL